MSVTFLAEWEKDPARYVRRKLEELTRLDCDRLAFARQQKAFGASPLTSKTAPHELSVAASVANPTDQGEHP